jgi:nicotinate phosphoribosyltransferase
VLTVEGDYTTFAHLETVYLGVLARRTRIATNVRRLAEAANGKDVLYFPARHDHFCVQAGDGYAAHVGGVTAVSTDAQGAWWGGRGIGTIPHALIAAYGGDTVLAAQRFAAWAPEDLNVVVLADFENDSVRTSLEVARALGPRLWGVRLDTSGELVDRSLEGEPGDGLAGVSEPLVRKVRDALDGAGFGGVRIVVSGGFTIEKVTAFEERGVPVDAYGVGSSLLRGENDFTADVVVTDGRPSAKVGRAFRRDPRLALVE